MEKTTILSLGFNLLNETQTEKTVGNHLIEKTDRVYSKVDLSGNKWQLFTYKQYSSYSFTFGLQFNGSVVLSDSTKDVSVNVTSKSSLVFWRKHTISDLFKVTTNKIQATDTLLELLKLNQDCKIELQREKNSVSFSCYLNQFNPEQFTKLYELITFVSLLK